MENQKNSLLYFHIFGLLYYHNVFRDIYNKEYASLARYEAKKYSTSEMSFCAGAPAPIMVQAYAAPPAAPRCRWAALVYTEQLKARILYAKGSFFMCWI